MAAGAPHMTVAPHECHQLFQGRLTGPQGGVSAGRYARNGLYACRPTCEGGTLHPAGRLEASAPRLVDDVGREGRGEGERQQPAHPDRLLLGVAHLVSVRVRLRVRVG